jgi:hypothetical protein
MTKSKSKRVAARAVPTRIADARAASAASECEREQMSVAGGPIGGALPTKRISSQEAAWHVCVSGAPPGG